MEKAILYDSSKCTACRGCQVACKSWNDLPAESTINSGSYENPPDLTPDTWMKIEFHELGEMGDIRWLFNRKACMHCTDAACIKVCPTGSVYRNENGFISYDKDSCSGCGYCEDACPFEVPRSERNLVLGTGKMDKCTACTTAGYDRIAEGMEPACVKTCPTGALAYGNRDDLITTAKARVQTLKADGVSGANLYGETELDGLHVLYVLEDSPDVYNLPLDPKISAATTLWKDILQPLGWIAGGLTIVGLGLNYVVARANVKKEVK